MTSTQSFGANAEYGNNQEQSRPRFSKSVSEVVIQTIRVKTTAVRENQEESQGKRMKPEDHQVILEIVETGKLRMSCNGIHIPLYPARP